FKRRVVIQEKLSISESHVSIFSLSVGLFLLVGELLGDSSDGGSCRMKLMTIFLEIVTTRNRCWEC
ncbi:hypothetical protein LINPERPRIM_LOCUS20806, partial [Linum perenne]